MDIAVNSGQEFVFGFGNSLSRASAKFSATGIIPKEQERTIVYKTVYVAEKPAARRTNDKTYFYADSKGNIRKTNRRYIKVDGNLKRTSNTYTGARKS